ncbi:hypothetical protein GUJ93_ZPchr0043g16399 [Zizania palustris]|uniref:Uncharacterized protein n=1 Tax=Zizania palustris TaxID=103762 RepID=A0A8J5VEF8_ZIZPA|nr:hypothetical protein GUJ93_ZPchr0043g16399 [Zizania palustris]
MPSRAAAVTSSAPSGVAMTSPASTFSWFSGKPASSSSSVMPPGGVPASPPRPVPSPKAPPPRAGGPEEWSPGPHRRAEEAASVDAVQVRPKSSQKTEKMELRQDRKWNRGGREITGAPAPARSPAELQDIVHYMRTQFLCSKAVSGVILQGV